MKKQKEANKLKKNLSFNIKLKINFEDEEKDSLKKNIFPPLNPSFLYLKEIKNKKKLNIKTEENLKKFNKSIKISEKKFELLKTEIENYHSKPSKSFIKINKDYLKKYNNNEPKLYLKNDTILLKNKKSYSNIFLTEPKKEIKKSKSNKNIIKSYKSKNINSSKNNYLFFENEIIKKKYNISLKKEKFLMLVDLKENKISSLNQQIIEMKKAIKLFKNNFLFNYNEYTKFLYKTIKNESSINNNFIIIINKIKNEIEKIKLKIKEKKNELIILKNWFVLFIALKEKIKIENIKIDNYKKYKIDLMFENENDFIHQFEYLCNYNIDLLNNLNKLKKKNIDLNRNLKNSNEIYLIENKFLLNEIETKEKFLIDLKNKNFKLMNERNNLLQNLNKNNNYYDKFSINSSISKKIFIIFKILNFYNNENKIIEFEEIKKNDIFLYLLFIEKIINIILNKIEYYKLNNFISYSFIIKDIYKITKKNKIKMFQENKNLKLEKMNKKNIEKHNKLFYLPNKRINFFYKYLMIKKLQIENNKKNKIEKKKLLNTNYSNQNVFQKIDKILNL